MKQKNSLGGSNIIQLMISFSFRCRQHHGTSQLRRRGRSNAAQLLLLPAFKKKNDHQEIKDRNGVSERVSLP
jgi:hypothetical protein